ncbi:MAG: hypothetical protein M5U19_17840 [Microthrixaceae bacterium]|nr:hypothetical protein [Microthrixaceae bacterium]
MPIRAGVATRIRPPTWAVVLDQDGWICSLDNLVSCPLLWNWTRSYGAPIWLWSGMKAPATAQPG